MERWKRLWDDIRPNLLWFIIYTFCSGGLVTAIVSGIRAWVETPITITGAIYIFVASLFVAAIGGAVYLRRLREGRAIIGEVADSKGASNQNWLIVVLSIVAIAQIGWNISLQRDIRLAQKHMERYVLPRQLSQAQKNTIAEYLSKVEPQAVVIRIIPRNEEAGSFRADLQQALEKAGWPIARFIYDETAQEGLSIHTKEPWRDTTQQTPFDRLNPPKRPSQILQEAFMQAKVFVNGGISSESSKSIGSEEITIIIGNRKRDKWAIPPGPANFSPEDYINSVEDPDR